MFEPSRAVTVKLREVPAVAGAGAVTEKWDAAPPRTLIESDVPAMEAVTESVAGMVWPPIVFSVAEKVAVPFVSVELAGRAAWLSVLCVAEGPVTLIEFEVPLIAADAVSLTETVSAEAVFSVTENVPVPLVNGELAGNTACGSVLVKCTVAE